MDALHASHRSREIDRRTRAYNEAVKLAVAAALGIGVLAIEARDSAACDRARSPMETPAVGIAVADVAIVGEVTKLDGKIATVKIARALKGAGSAGDTIRVHGVTGIEPMTRMCGMKALEVGKPYILLLWSPAGAATGFHLVDEMGGIADHTAAAEQQFKAALAQQHPHSAWHTEQGIMTQLVLEPNPAHKRDVDLLIVLRNTTAQPIRLAYRDWPLATKSKCALDVVHTATKRKVASQDVPIPKRDITAYFSKHGRSYDVAIEPGASHVFRLARVTTALPGWGYKEELGFVFYPIGTPGAHAISAVCSNLFGAGTTTSTEAISLLL